MSLASYVSTGTVQTTITSTRNSNSASVSTTSDVKNLSILQGLITASDVKAVGTSTATSSGATSTTSGTNFAGLKVADNSISGTPQPDTTIQLPSLGYVVLNEEGFNNGIDATSVGINMIDLHVTQSNAFNVTAGTRIIIAQVNSSETRTPVPVIANAIAYALSGSGLGGSGSSTSGPYSLTAIDCSASSNAQNGIQQINASTAGSTGAVSSSASGQITQALTTADSQVNVQNLSEIGSLISVGSITTTAHAQWNTSGSVSASVNFSNAKVNGQPSSNNPAPNKNIPIPGVGYVVLNEQSSTVNASGASITVIAIDIYITHTNAFSLPVGAHIIVGRADAGVTFYN
ncbi:MAG: hypothetical protein NVSMB27_43670 [Ktedonobacteraceae bacterium]